jgi:hypothetical protein
MESEKNTKDNQSPRIRLIPLLWFGIPACFLAVVGFWCVANQWGPYSKNIMMDWYSGHSIVYKNSLGRHSSIPSPIAPHTQWAIDHQNPVRNWYIYAAGFSRSKWFGRGFFVDAFLRDYIYEIFNLSMSEDEKVELLHEYHGDLDVLKSKEEDKTVTSEDWASFRKKWNQKLDRLKENTDSK